MRSLFFDKYLTLHVSEYITTGLHEIGTHVVRPFFLPPRVKLLDTLQGTYLLYCTFYGQYFRSIHASRSSLRYLSFPSFPPSFLTSPFPLLFYSSPFLSSPPPHPPFLLFSATPTNHLLQQTHPTLLTGDPQQRFVILGFGNDTRVMMRDFRVDEPEIEEFIEHWRRLIASEYSEILWLLSLLLSLER